MNEREREAVRYLARKAVADGRLKKSKRCKRCGRAGKVEAHHADYSKPLEVEWLCRSCHGRLHPRGEHNRRAPMPVESAIIRALAGEERDMAALVLRTRYARTTVHMALHRLIGKGEVQRKAGRPPITYRLTRAGKARWREDEKYLKEGRG